MFDTVGCSYFSLLNEFFCCQATFRRSDYLFRVFFLPSSRLEYRKAGSKFTEYLWGDPDAYVTTLHFCSIGSSCLLLICLSGRWHLAVLCVHMCAIYSAFPSVITRPFHNPRSGQIGVDVQREDAECRIPITKDPVNWIAGQQHPLDKTEGNRQGRITDDKEKQRRTIHRRLIRGV